MAELFDEYCIAALRGDAEEERRLGDLLSGFEQEKRKNLPTRDARAEVAQSMAAMWQRAPLDVKAYLRLRSKLDVVAEEDPDEHKEEPEAEAPEAPEAAEQPQPQPPPPAEQIKVVTVRKTKKKETQ